MRVFVTGTGRCGSVCFKSACSHMTNYTVAHESRSGLLCYPDNHIEVNPQLRLFIPAIARRYPDARWVHLVRDREATARSLARLDKGEWIARYASAYGSLMPTDDRVDWARRVYDGWVDAIDAMLTACVPAEQRETLRLESIKQAWPGWWRSIGAQGDYCKSADEWDTPKNTSEQRGDA